MPWQSSRPLARSPTPSAMFSESTGLLESGAERLDTSTIAQIAVKIREPLYPTMEAMIYAPRASRRRAEKHVRRCDVPVLTLARSRKFLPFFPASLESPVRGAGGG